MEVLVQALPDSSESDRKILLDVLARSLSMKSEDVWNVTVPLRGDNVSIMYVVTSERMRQNGWKLEIPDYVPTDGLDKKLEYDLDTYPRFDWLGCDRLINDGLKYDGSEPPSVQTIDGYGIHVPRAFGKSARTLLTKSMVFAGLKAYFFETKDYLSLAMLFNATHAVTARHIFAKKLRRTLINKDWMQILQGDSSALHDMTMLESTEEGVRDLIDGSWMLLNDNEVYIPTDPNHELMSSWKKLPSHMFDVS